MYALTPPAESDGGRIPKACLPCARAKVRCEIDPGREACKRYSLALSVLVCACGTDHLEGVDV